MMFACRERPTQSDILALHPEAGALSADGLNCFKEMPSWVGGPTATVDTQTSQDLLSLSFSGVGPMKWLCRFLPLYTDPRGVVTLRYRAEHIQAGDYFFWIGDKKNGISVPGSVVSDGTWQTLAIDLTRLGLSSGVIESLALSLKSDTSAALFELADLKYDRTAADKMQVLPPKEKDNRNVTPSLGWTPHSDWLGNPDLSSQIRGQELTVPQAQLGMKWSAALPDVTGLHNVRIKMRGRGLARTQSYAVTILQKAPLNDIPLILLQDLSEDFDRTFELPIYSQGPIEGIAVQVQAAEEGAYIAIDELEFNNHSSVSVASVLPESAQEKSGFIPLDLALDTPLTSLQAAFGFSGALNRQGIFEGVRFKTSNEPSSAIRADENVLPINKVVKSLCFLGAVRLNGPDNSGAAARRNSVAEHTEEIVAHIKYAGEAASQDYLPLRLENGRLTNAGIADGFSVFCLPRLKAKTIESVQFDLKTDHSDLYILAASFHPSDSIAYESIPTAPFFNEDLYNAQDLGSASLHDRQAFFKFADTSFHFDFSNGLSLTMENTQCHCTIYSGPIFSASQQNGTLFDSSTWQTTQVNQSGNSVDASLSQPTLGMTVSVHLEALASGEVLFKTKFAGNTADVSVPHLNRISISSDDWYFIPAVGGYLHRKPSTFNLNYDHFMPVPFMATFATSGSGFYAIAADQTTASRKMYFKKHDGSEDMAFNYKAGALADHKVILGISKAGWRSALNATQRHIAGQLQKKSLPWFQDVYNYRTHFISGDLFDASNNAFSFASALAHDTEITGHADYLNIFDFGSSPEYGRVCDYNHWHPFTEPTPLRNAIEATKNAGTRVGLYVEGYLCSRRSVWGQSRWQQDAIKSRDGQVMVFADAVSDEPVMCPYVAEWQDHLADVYQGIFQAVAPDGLYIDEFGYVGEERRCFDPNHGHPIGASMLAGEDAFLNRVVPGLPESAAFHGEFSPVAPLVQKFHGTLSYSMTNTDQTLGFTGLDYYRFLFPWFKVIQIASYLPFTNGNERILKKVFFNAEGLYTLQSADPSSFSDAAQRMLKKGFVIMQKYKDAFRDPAPIPLVATEPAGVFVHEFISSGKSVWSIYNSNPWPIESLRIKSKRMKNAACNEEWRSQSILCKANQPISVLVGAEDIAFISQ